jgi:hypothetical protein
MPVPYILCEVPRSGHGYTQLRHTELFTLNKSRLGNLPNILVNIQTKGLKYDTDIDNILFFSLSEPRTFPWNVDSVETPSAIFFSI